MHTISWLLLLLPASLGPSSPLACPGAAAAPRGEIRWFNGFGSGERGGREEEAAGGGVAWVAGARFPCGLASSPLEKGTRFSRNYYP